MLSKDDELRKNPQLIVSSAFGVACSSIVLPYYTMSALVTPVATEFGWARSDMLLSLTFSSIMGALSSPVVGVLIERFGARRVALPGLVGLAMGFAFASTVDGQLWLFYLAYAAIALLGAGTIPVTWSKAISANFNRRRGLALGLALSGTGVCGALVPSYTVWLTDQYGWRAAYLGLAALPLLIATPVVFAWFHPDRDPLTAAPDQAALDVSNEWGYRLSEALRQYRYWALLLSIFAIYMAVSGLVPNLIPALTERNISRSDAAGVVGMFGVAIIVGRLAVGYLVDNFWAPAVTALTMCLPVAGALLLTGELTYLRAAMAVIMIGLAAGAELDLMAFLAAKYFGLQHYATIYGTLYAALALCQASSSWFFARINELTGSYDMALQVAAGLFAAGGLLVLTMGRYPTATEPATHPQEGP